MRRTRGFTLQEVMISLSLMTIVMGSAYSLHSATIRFGADITIQTGISEEASRVMLSLSRIIPSAVRGSLSLSAPDVLEFVTAEGPCRLGVDTQDINGDGLRDTQLVYQHPGGVSVISNQLLPNEDANGNGVFDNGEDIRLNAALDRGVLFTLEGDTVRVKLTTLGVTKFHRFFTATLPATFRARN